jgi:ankyrin repeat protein
LLIERGADINKTGYDGRVEVTPLCYALKHGYSDIAKLLLQKGADVNKPGWDNDTPLVCAIKNPVLDQKYLENNSSWIRQIITDYKRNSFNSESSAKDLVLLYHPNKLLIKLLLDNGADEKNAMENGRNTLDFYEMFKNGIFTLIKLY